MSLTNPKDVVTEERLKDFYDGIYPYLGGMPEILANKFSRSDLYSTTEKVVGCWTDGRPLYQRNFSNTTGAKNAWKTILNLGTTCLIVKWDAYVNNAQGLYIKTGFSSGGTTMDVVGNFGGASAGENGKLSLFTSDPNMASRPCYGVVWYTKTTDAANSFNFSSETDYSTTEKIVGTWIDGKPIYQKTYSTDSLSLTGPMTDIALSTIGINNIDYITVKEAFLYFSDGYWITSPFYASSSDFMNVSAFNLDSGNDIFRISVPSNYVSKVKKIRVTFQYTKTS